MRIVKSIKKHEGFRSRMYLDTVGVPTIGYGFNLKTIELPKPVAELWLAYEIEKHEEELERFDFYHDLDRVRKDVLLDMHYNLGDSRFRGFQKMIQALENHNYNEAAKEMLDSKWANQVGRRATDLAALMRENDNMGI